MTANLISKILIKNKILNQVSLEDSIVTFEYKTAEQFVQKNLVDFMQPSHAFG